MTRFALSVVAVAMGLAGCAVHPLPKDVTGVSTVAIVEHVRCEARRAIQDKAIERLAADQDPENQRLARELNDHREEFLDIKETRIPERDLRFFRRYIETGLALDFTLDITEDNKAGTTIDLAKVISGGTFSLPLMLSGEESRENIRKFLISDTFITLLHEKTMHCEGDPYLTDIAYPITGSVGLREVISTFIDLNEGFKVTPGSDKAYTLGDTLKFMTIVTGSASPKVTLTPAGRAFQVADATLSTTDMRTDTNSLLVGLSLGGLDKAAVVPAVAAAPFGGAVSARSALAKPFVHLSPAEERAIIAVTQQRLDTFYDKLGSALR